MQTKSAGEVIDGDHDKSSTEKIVGETGTEIHLDVGGIRRCQSLQMVELLLDLIYGDLVHGDKVCRRVADAMIAAYEGAIQWLVTSETTFTKPLKGAINTYCARYVLRTAPEILIASRDAAAAYKQIALVLRDMETLESVGEAIVEELAHLTRRLETKRFSHLLDLMGDAVLVCMRKAAKQHEEEKAKDTSMRAEPSFWAGVARFIALPVPTREGKKRGRDGDHDVEVASIDVTPACDFSAELSLAMRSAERRNPAFSESIQGTTRVKQRLSSSSSPTPVSVSTSLSYPSASSAVACTGRALLQANDSVLGALERLDGKDSQTVQDISSSIVVDDSLDATPVPSSSMRKDFIIPGFGGGDTSLLGGDVQERGYFLCDKAHSYIPTAARGFFT